MFAGFSAFPITPADESGRVDVDCLADLTDRLASADVQSIGVLGSTGTYMFLSRQERARALRAASEASAGRVPMIAGVGAMRTDEAVALAEDAQTAGADGLLLAPVSYTPLTDEEVYAHFVAVADATDLPLLIYNNPGTTRFEFSYDLIVRLAEHRNIKAIKMPATSDYRAELSSLRARLPSDFVMGYSADWVMADAMTAGADAFYSAVGGILSRETSLLFRAAQDQDPQMLEAAEVAFAPLWALCKAHGSLRVIYAIAAHLELSQHQLPKPLLPLDEKSALELASALERVRSL